MEQQIVLSPQTELIWMRNYNYVIHMKFSLGRGKKYALQQRMHLGVNIDDSGGSLARGRRSEC